jgi:hypothetical protein
MAKPLTAEKKFDGAKIRSWMRRNAPRFVDRTTGEVDLTLMVETWDLEVWDGEMTFGEEGASHVAWDIAVEVGDAYERAARRAS